MCGIAGIVDSSENNSLHVQRMIDALIHRGPDDSGVFSGKGATLGHRRLSIIGLSTGHQPMVDNASGLSITFNGEIYNYQELRDDLIADGIRFDTYSDTEVILRLYCSRGTEMLSLLRGMFAFAIWDEKKRTLFAARDHLGQKPFYYTLNNRKFAFSSEIKGLIAYDPSLREVDAEALDQYFTLRLIASPYSMFRRIRKLPPAHFLTYSQTDGLHVERYWDLSFSPKDVRSEQDILDELESRLIDSIRLHMVSDVPVGAFMSSGLDSTLVTALMMKHAANSPFPTFTLGLPHQQYNEAPLARQVAEMYGTEHHEIVDVPSLTENLADLVYHLDEPSDPLSVCTYAISRVAREHVKVVLGGDGGDELFGGYDRYFGIAYAGYYAHIPESVRRTLIGPALDRLSGGTWYKSKAHQLKWLHRLSFEQGGERYAESLNYSYFSDSDKKLLYGRTMKEMISDFDAKNLIAEAYASAKSSEPLDRMLYADNLIRLSDHPVMISDRMSMAHGLEVRSPYMDHRLVEFMASIPARMKVRGRKLKYLQRLLAERYLPKAVLSFPKQGFASPLPYLLRAEYEKMFRCLLTQSELANAGFVNKAYVDQLLSDHVSGRSDNATRLWIVMNAEVWYRMHILGADRESVRSMLTTQ